MIIDEKELYEPIKTKLYELITKKIGKCYLEITANKTFSNKIKKMIDEKREIVFNYLKEAAPDITGYVEADLFSLWFSQKEFIFIVVEIKLNKLKLDDIYQVRKYAELFDARYTFLISPEEIPEELKRLSKSVPKLLSQPDGEKIIIAQYDILKGYFREWFPKNPF